MINIEKDFIIECLKKRLTIFEISKIVGCDRNVITKRLKLFNIDKNIYKFNYNFFETVNTEEKAYWLGFLAADGSVYKNKSGGYSIVISSKDLDHIDKYKKDLGCIKNTYVAKSGVGSFYVCSKKMFDDLGNYGIVPRKTYHLKFPDKLDKALLKHYIRGYFDGDGSIYISTNKKNGYIKPMICFVGASLEFLEKLRESLSINTRIYKDKAERRRGYYNLRVYNLEDIYRIMDWMYEDCKVFLNRKKEKWVKIKQILQEYRGKQKAFNRPDATKYLAFGENKSSYYWSIDSRCKVNKSCLNTRISNGWDIEKAITTPLKQGFFKAFNEEKTVDGWSKDSRCVVDKKKLRNRIYNNWDIEKAITTPSNVRKNKLENI